jgi:integrase
LRITVGRSKTDQEGEGAVVGIAYGTDWRTCPVRAWRAWVEAARLVDGPAFRNLRNGAVTGERIAGGGIARVVKRRAQAAGLDPALFSGHSLRSGFATTAARHGAPEHKIMRQGRWTTSAAMRGYIREGELFVNNPSAKLGCRRLLMARSPIDDSMRQAKGQSDGAAVAVA